MTKTGNNDPVLKLVHRSVRQFGLVDEGPIGQQILLLGDMFYGYRFASKEFTAVWSAVDQTLSVFDQVGKRLGSTLVDLPGGESNECQGSIRLPEKQPSLRRVA